MEQKKDTFKVVYGLEDIVKGLELEHALQFALNLHNSSNVGHVITVDKDGEDTTTVLTLNRPV